MSGILLSKPAHVIVEEIPGVVLASQQDLSEYLTTYASKIHGLGLFAKVDIQQGDLICREVIDDPRTMLSRDDGPLRWTNHSDEPNGALLTTYDRTRDALEWVLVALRFIPVGEEITYNYENGVHSGHRSDCHCGSPDCKGSFILREDWGERK